MEANSPVRRQFLDKTVVKKIINNKINLSKGLKEVFKNIYTLSHLLSVRKIASKLINEELKSKEKKESAVFTQRMKPLNEKIAEVERSIKEDLFDNKKNEKVKQLIYHWQDILKQSESKAKLEEKKGDDDEDTIPYDVELLKALQNLNLEVTLDTIFISKNLIINKMKELISLVSKSDATYEKVSVLINEILKTKSNIEETTKIKNSFKDSILIPILKKKGPIKESSRQKLLDNVTKFYKKFQEVMNVEDEFADEKAIAKQEMNEADMKINKGIENTLRDWKAENEKRIAKLELEKQKKIDKQIKNERNDEKLKRDKEDDFIDSD